MPPLDPPETHDPMSEDPDLPPESIQLPILADDLRWIKLNKAFDRGLSTIGNANPKSSRSSNISTKPKSHLQSQQNLKPPSGPIPGLPNSAFHLNGSRPLPTLRIFPLDFSVRSKPAGPDPESPKVSCFGRVLEEREGKGCREERAGCWGNFSVLFGFAGVFPAGSGEEEEEEEVGERRSPELQGMRRFASGRRGGHVASLEPLDRERVIPRSVE